MSTSSHGARTFAKPIRKTVDLESVLQRAQFAFDACVRDSQGELLVLIDRLIAIDTGQAAYYQGASLREVLRCANDLRGAALTLGSETAAEVADAIFEFSEAVYPDGRVPKPLIVLLARSCRHLADPAATGDKTAYQAQLQALLTEARGKLLEEVVGRP